MRFLLYDRLRKLELLLIQLSKVIKRRFFVNNYETFMACTMIVLTLTDSTNIRLMYPRVMKYKRSFLGDNYGCKYTHVQK